LTGAANWAVTAEQLKTHDSLMPPAPFVGPAVGDFLSKLNLAAAHDISLPRTMSSCLAGLAYSFRREKSNYSVLSS
jgi:hypothetical protein